MTGGTRSVSAISISESESILMTGSDLACSRVIVGGGDEHTSTMDLVGGAAVNRTTDEELELLDSSSTIV